MVQGCVMGILTLNWVFPEAAIRMVNGIVWAGCVSDSKSWIISFTSHYMLS